MVYEVELGYIKKVKVKANSIEEAIKKGHTGEWINEESLIATNDDKANLDYLELFNEVMYEDRYIDENTVTLYYIAPKELLNCKLFEKCRFEFDYPEAESMEISIDISPYCFNNCIVSSADVMISPTVDNTDCDWRSVELPYEILTKLICLAREKVAS